MRVLGAYHAINLILNTETNSIYEICRSDLIIVRVESQDYFT